MSNLKVGPVIKTYFPDKNSPRKDNKYVLKDNKNVPNPLEFEKMYQTIVEKKNLND